MLEVFKLRKLIHLLTNRLTIIGLLLLAQIIFIVWFLYQFTQTWYYFHFATIIIGAIFSLYIITKDENPMFQLIWVVFILILPLFGVIFYIYSRTEKLSFSRHSLMIYYKKLREQEMAKIEHHEADDYRKHQEYLRGLYYPSFRNTKSIFLKNGEVKLQYLLKALKEAKHFIFMEYFIITESKMWNDILNVLKEKVKEGVLIRIMYDDFGSATKLPFHYHKYLKKLGFEVIRFNPMKLHINYAMNYRDHRKIVVIDNKYAFTGGFNIGDEYTNKKKVFGHWNDAGIMIEGKAVWGMTLLFLENWSFSSKDKKIDFNRFNLTHQVENDAIYIPFGDIPTDNHLTAKSMYLHLINDAKHSIDITAPYLILDNEIKTALKLAAESGIDVNIIVPSIPDKKLVYMVSESYVEELMLYGVNVYKYVPGFIHSKMIICDKEVAMIGSSNLDFRSLYMHLENNLWLNDTQTIEEMNSYIEETKEVSIKLTPKHFKRKSILYRMIQTILKGFSPLL